MSALQGYDGLRARFAALERTTELMQKLGLAAVAEAKMLVPRKTSNLGRSIHLASWTETSARIEASAGYAAYVELGTRAHIITPNARKALRWAAKGVPTRLSGRPTVGAVRAGGAYAFAKIVHHPGTRAQPYLVPGAKRAVEGAGLAPIIDAWNR